MLVAEERSFIGAITAPSGAGKISYSSRRAQFKLLTRILGILLSFMLINLIFQALVVQQNHQIRTWQAKINDLQRETIELRIEIAKLESFDRIQTLAQTRLGMRTPGPQEYRCIAAAPVEHPQLYSQTGRPTSETNNPWEKLSNWIGGIGETLAQTP